MHCGSKKKLWHDFNAESRWHDFWHELGNPVPGVKELMKLMGLPNWMHWTSWFLNALATSAITIMIAVVLMCVEWKSGSGKVLDFSNYVVIWNVQYVLSLSYCVL
jgi:hypothetical protein